MRDKIAVLPEYRGYAFLMDDTSANSYLSNNSQSEECSDVIDYIVGFANTKCHILPKTFSDLVKVNPNDDGYIEQIKSLFVDGAGLIGSASFDNEEQALIFMAGVIAFQTGKKIMIITQKHENLQKEFGKHALKVVPSIVGLKSLTCLIVDPSTARSILRSSDDEFASELPK